jgi:hypothetical protein
MGDRNEPAKDVRALINQARSRGEDPKTAFEAGVKLGSNGEVGSTSRDSTEFSRCERQQQFGSSLEEGDDSRPRIQMPGDDRLVSDFGAELGVILNSQAFFDRDGICVRLTYHSEIKAYVLEQVNPYWFTTGLEGFCIPYYLRKDRTSKEIIEITHTVSSEIARKTLLCPAFLEKLRKISSLHTVQIPILRRSGQIELLPIGYDPESAGYTTPDSCDYAKDIKPEEAVGFLRDLLSEFCFHPEDRERATAVTVSAMLTLFCISLLPKEASRPIFLYTANAEGCGKTLLLKLAMIPLLGYAPTGSCPQDEAEMRKLILSTAISGSPVLFLDNIKGHISSGSLEALATSPVIKDRILGESRTVELLHGLTVYATGNDMTCSPDLRRRSLLIELRLDHVRAEDRVIRRPLDDVSILALRPKILGCLWAITKAWDQSGRPKAAIRHPSFLPWSDCVAGITENAKFASPCTTPLTDTSGDRVLADLQKLVELMNPETEYKFTDIIELSRDNGLLERLVPDQGDLKPEQRSRIGKLLRKFVDRTFPSGFRLGLIGDTRKTERFVVTRP